MYIKENFNTEDSLKTLYVRLVEVVGKDVLIDIKEEKAHGGQRTNRGK